MINDMRMHLPPPVGSPAWQRVVALDLATRDDGGTDDVLRRAAGYLTWLAGAEFGALGHPGATNSPDAGADRGAPETGPQNGAQRAKEMVEASAGAPVVHAALATDSVVGSLRDALASDDPEVVREAAGLLGLTEEEWDIRGAHGSSCVTSWRTQWLGAGEVEAMGPEWTPEWRTWITDGEELQ